MTRPDPEQLLRHVLDRGAGLPTPRCLDDDTIAALAEGTLDVHSRAAAILHLADCAQCRVAVASVARALADPAVARKIPRPTGAGRRLWQVAVPAAAAAIVLLVAMPGRKDDGAPLHRAPTITAVSAPVPMSPVGIVAAAETLRWTTVGGADRYRTTLFDDAGAVLFETQTANTVAALPDSVRLAPGRSYLWKVEARTGWDRWSASELIEFSIR
jgi:anti-sigma factor ChrR (cupin superfamily)